MGGFTLWRMLAPSLLAVADGMAAAGPVTPDGHAAANPAARRGAIGPEPVAARHHGGLYRISGGGEPRA